MDTENLPVLITEPHDDFEKEINQECQADFLKGVEGHIATLIAPSPAAPEIFYLAQWGWNSGEWQMSYTRYGYDELFGFAMKTARILKLAMEVRAIFGDETAIASLKLDPDRLKQMREDAADILIETVNNTCGEPECPVHGKNGLVEKLAAVRTGNLGSKNDGTGWYI